MSTLQGMVARSMWRSLRAIGFLFLRLLRARARRDRPTSETEPLPPPLDDVFTLTPEVDPGD